VRRCLALATELRTSGCDVHFVSRAEPGHLHDEIVAEGYRLHALPPSTNSDLSAEPDEVGQRNFDWRSDANAVAAVIATLDGRPSWIVTDHYGIGEAWERALRDYSDRVLAIDDLADRAHDCDVLVDPSLVAHRDQRYAGLVPGSCRPLLGPEYALLQPSYGLWHDRVPVRDGQVRRLLIFLGDAGPSDLTGRVLEALESLAQPDLRVDVVLARENPHASCIRSRAQAIGHVQVYQGLSSLLPLMVQADAAIGAGGSTSWERLCLGLPSLVISLAQNQRPIAAGLHDAGLVRWIGHREDVSVTNWIEAIGSLLREKIDRVWSLRCRETVDGRGARRVADAMCVDAATAVIVRPCVAGDVALLQALGAQPPLAAAALESQMREIETRRAMVVVAPSGLPLSLALAGRVDGRWHFDVHLLPHALPLTRPAIEAAALGGLRESVDGRLALDPPKAGGAPAVRQWRIALCTADGTSWIGPYVARIALQLLQRGHAVEWVYDVRDAADSDICFLLGYGAIVSATERDRHGACVVVHESDVPEGRGWSPMSWQVLEGRSRVVVTLLAAADAVDSGDILRQLTISLDGTELVDDWRALQAAATNQLCVDFVDGFPESLAARREQTGTPTYYRRRRPTDSQLDLRRPLADQMPLLRVVDNDRYPAWVDVNGHCYELHVFHAGSRPSRGPVVR
jgi:UDP-2,4-diacetamido-2,4,6-trideoxy-beta-L-altropyranose hydrolase